MSDLTPGDLTPGPSPKERVETANSQIPKGGLNISAAKKYIPYLIAILSFFAALFYNELNIQALKSGARERLEPKYNWVHTADDISYLRPAENYYLRGVWKDNNPGRQSYFLRTPGYGLFRYCLMRVMGIDRSYFYFKYIQLLLFSISVLLLFRIVILSGLPERYAIIVAAMYGLSPFACGFLYYSLTEGITPALIIAYSYFLQLAYRRNKPIHFITAALIMGYIGITRPVLLIFGAALPYAIYGSAGHLSFGMKILFILLTGLISLAPIAAWAIRSDTIAGSYVGIYPIYYLENNSQYRPTHQAIWEFEKSYGTEGKDYHALMVPLWTSTLKGDTSELHIDSIMMVSPYFVKRTIGEGRLRNSYILYRRSIVYQRSHYPLHSAMPDTVPEMEKQVISDFHTYTDEVNSKYWFWCHVIVPLRLFKSLSFHSNLSLYMFQHTYRDRWWMEALRLLFLILHFLCCLSFIFVMLSGQNRLMKLIAGGCIGIYFFYLCYVFRGLEERYTLPVLPLMILGLTVCIHRAVNQNNVILKDT